MSNYIQIQFSNISSEQAGVLVALLTETGFEGFEEGEGVLRAFISSDQLDIDGLNSISKELQLEYEQTVIQETNWNTVWESNFEPVVVDDFAGIRASFHPPLASVQHEIIITPKMSFGTGHHATTYMMISQMRSVNFAGRKVLDFGTGTGILAILADKLGAAAVLGIDNDEWSIRNAMENIDANSCGAVEILPGNSLPTGRVFDVILANINKHVILDQFPALVNSLEKGGILLLSGLLKEDEDDIFRKMAAYSLHLIQTDVRSNWLCVKASC
jgi:ribosomal protein L11 methyltransferase